MKKSDFIATLKELNELAVFVMNNASDVKGITDFQKSLLNHGARNLETALTLVENDTDDLVDRPTVPYEMDLMGPYKVAKHKVVGDFSMAYANRLSALCNGNYVAAAKVAGLEVSNYKRSIRNATDGRWK